MQEENKNRLSSDKCDFKFAFGDLKFEGKKLDSGTKWSSESLNRKILVQSSKCDWRIATHDAEFNVNSFRSPTDFLVDSKIKGFKASMGSDKCDFKISSKLDLVLPMEMKAESPAVNMQLSSDKCDWKIQALAGNPASKARPQFSASLSSDKGDFTLNIRFGMEGARSIYVGAISSDKCDFKINDSSIYENKG